MDEIWGADSDTGWETVTVHIGRLRKRFESWQEKEDHMRNGQLKPGYDIQIGAESKYIVGVGSFSNGSDVGDLIPFLNRIRKHTNRKYENIVADAGYESSENYLYLAKIGSFRPSFALAHFCLFSRLFLLFLPFFLISITKGRAFSFIKSF